MQMQCGHWQRWRRSFPDVQIYLSIIQKSYLQIFGKNEKPGGSGPAVPGDEDRSLYSWPVVGGNRKGEGRSEGNFVGGESCNCKLIGEFPAGLG